MYGRGSQDDCEVQHLPSSNPSSNPSAKVSAMNRIESVPTTWDDLRDGQFFRIVGHVLDCHVLEAASCLLAANDSELAPY